MASSSAAAEFTAARALSTARALMPASMRMEVFPYRINNAFPLDPEKREAIQSSMNLSFLNISIKIDERLSFHSGQAKELFNLLYPNTAGFRALDSLRILAEHDSGQDAAPHTARQCAAPTKTVENRGG